MAVLILVLLIFKLLINVIAQTEAPLGNLPGGKGSSLDPSARPLSLAAASIIFEGQAEVEKVQIFVVRDFPLKRASLFDFQVVIQLVLLDFLLENCALQKLVCAGSLFWVEGEAFPDENSQTPSHPSDLFSKN